MFSDDQRTLLDYIGITPEALSTAEKLHAAANEMHESAEQLMVPALKHLKTLTDTQLTRLANLIPRHSLVRTELLTEINRRKQTE